LAQAVFPSKLYFLFFLEFFWSPLRFTVVCFLYGSHRLFWFAPPSSLPVDIRAPSVLRTVDDRSFYRDGSFHGPRDGNPTSLFYNSHPLFLKTPGQRESSVLPLKTWRRDFLSPKSISPGRVVSSPQLFRSVGGYCHMIVRFLSFFPRDLLPLLPSTSYA